MVRSFSFPAAVLREARLRQSGLCALCGDPLDNVEENGHHVVPNQSGMPGNREHRWLASAENCVVLCHACHDAVHAGGRFKQGAVAPPDYFPYSHGADRNAHTHWVALVLAMSRSVWA